jgi:hypothetical protein
MSKIEFQAELLKHPNLDATFFEFPFDTIELFGTKGQVKVKANIEGIEYRGSLVKIDKNSCHLLGITKEIRKKINKNPGDIINVIIEKDDEERILQIPLDLSDKLSENQEIFQYFNTLSYTHRKEYIVWIESAKKAETRQIRIQKTLEMLKKKIKHP